MTQPGYYDDYTAQTEEPSETEPGAAIWDNGLVISALSALGVAVGFLVLIAIVKKFLWIARPNQALIFSGKRSKNAVGEMVGYRVVQQGHRALQIPIIQTVHAMDMQLIPIDVVVQDAYSMGNIPLQIRAIANVKVHSDERYIGNAIERFLGRSRSEISLVAQQTLEGAVREVLATLTPEEVNEDRLLFAEKLTEAAKDDLDKLGLQLDVLKIQNVSDDRGYLDSLGRPHLARVRRDAENAENEAQQIIIQAQAASRQRAEVARANAEKAIQQKINDVRRVKAELEGTAQSVERESEAAAKVARASAEQQLQRVRAELEKRRLQANVVIPAEMQRQAQALIAIGDAAPTQENGAAVAQVLSMLGETWKEMGPKAQEIYVIQHLEEIVGTVVKNLHGIHVGEVNVVDRGDGMGLSSYAATYPQMVATVMRALSESTGVDVPSILRGQAGGVA